MGEKNAGPSPRNERSHSMDSTPIQARTYFTEAVSTRNVVIFAESVVVRNCKRMVCPLYASKLNVLSEYVVDAATLFKLLYVAKVARSVPAELRTSTNSLSYWVVVVVSAEVTFK